MIRKERSDGIAVFVAYVLREKFTQDTKPRQQQVRRHHADKKRKTALDSAVFLVERGKARGVKP